MNRSNKMLYILITIISLLIMFFLFPLNGHAEDTGYVEYNYALYHEYTGEEILLDDLVLKFNGTTLVKDTDYTITYLSTNLSEVGTKMLKITLDEDSDYVTQEATKEDTITYYVVDKIIDLSDYGISEGMTVEKENGEASLNSLAAPISEAYSEYLTIADSTTTSNDGTLSFTFNTEYDSVINYKDAYNKTYYKYSKQGDPILNINFFAVDVLITENDERIEIDNLNNLAYKLDSNSSVDVSWEGDILFENSLLTAETDYDTYLYIPELYGNETAVTSIDSTYTDGSVYNVILQIVFKGDYGGSITKTLKLCPSIENADIEALEGGNVTHEQSGYIISLVYGSDTIPICLKMTIDGQEKTLVYGTDFTYDSSVLWGQVGMGGISLDIQGIGNYAGQRDNVWVYLSAKSITSDTITYEANSNAYYDGTNNPALGIIIYDNDIPGDNKVISDDYYEITIISLDSENRIGTARVEGTIAYKDYFDVEFELATRRWGDDGLVSEVNWDIDDHGYYYMFQEHLLEPDFTITDTVNGEKYTLVEGTDFDSSVEESSDGSYNLYIKLKGNYIGDIFHTYNLGYKITQDDDKLEVIGISADGYIIGGETTFSPRPVLTYDGQTISNDYYTTTTVVKDSNGNVHTNGSETGIAASDADGSVYTAYVTITFNGKYSGELNYEVDICPRIDSGHIVLLDNGRLDGRTIYYGYTGETIVPLFDIELVIEQTNETRTLKIDEDFIISNIDELPKNVDSDGNGVDMYIEGIGNYAGGLSFTIMVEAKSIESSDISVSISNNCYVSTNLESSDAQTYECDFILYDETRDYNLVPNEDFEVGYEAVDDMVIVYFSGINNYSGNLEKNVHKATAKLKADIVDITYDTAYNDYNAMYYTGSETHPEVKVAIGETELVLDTDYSVSYEAKSEYSYGSMVVLHIVGLNSFYGKLDYEYIIYSQLFEDLELPYEGTKKVSELLENNDLSDAFSSIADDIEVSNCGEYEVTATLAKGYVFKVDDEYSLTGTFKINIIPLEITNDFEITIEDVRYTKEELKPSITIVDYNGNELEEDKDYTVTLENNTNVGHGNVLITGIGNYSGEIEKEFNILGKSLESEDIKVTKDSNCYIDNENNYYFEISLYDETFDYTLVKDTDYEISFEQGINAVEFYVTGIGNYAERLKFDVDKASYLLTDDNITITYDEVTEENIMYLSDEETYPIVEIKYNDTLLVLGTDYEVSFDGDYAYNSIIKLNIKGVKDYYINYNSSFRIESQDKKVNEIIEDAATDIISSATKSADLDLDSINFEDLTGLSKDELLKAKEYYNNLEQYIIDNKLDETVNKRLEEQGYSIRIEAADLASKLKDYLDKYATNAGYTNFNSQVDDVINALTVEEEKEALKEELLAYVHKHITPGTLNPIHNSSSNQNENNKNDNEQINSLIDEQLESVRYEQCLDDSLRNDQLNNAIGQVHEIKNVSLSIIKHAQKQTIANNNIEAYYNELVESGKYNEAQLALLKEVFDEMQEEVLELLNDGNIDSQEELDKIVLKAIEKLSGVPITNLRAISEDGINVNISSSSGMSSDTELKISYGAKNVSIAIGRAINNNNVSGKEDGILLIKNKEVKEAFDIDLIENGDVVKEFNGTYTIKILLTDELKAFNNLQIIYITSDGNVEVHDTYIEGDYLVFTTTHFSTYYLLGDKLFDFAPIIKILLAVIVSLIIFIVYLVLKIKKKKINQLGIISSLAFIPLSLVFSINVLVVCIILGIVAFILLVVAVLLAIKDYKIDRRINDEE